LAAGREDWRPVLRPARGAERVQWADPEVIQRGIAARLTGPRQALSHLPEHEILGADRETLRKRGRVFNLPDAVADGECWLGLYNGDLKAVLRREGTVGRVARMIVSD
jgi:hypothetical protein